MTSEAIVKCLLWSFLLLWANENIFYSNAASILGNPTPLSLRNNNVNNFIKHFKRSVEHQQQAAAKTQSFLELILGIIDTLQFGKRKIGAAT